MTGSTYISKLKTLFGIGRVPNGNVASARYAASVSRPGYFIGKRVQISFVDTLMKDGIMDPIRHQPVDASPLAHHTPSAERPANEVQAPQHLPSNTSLPAFAAASASTFSQFSHRHPGGDASLHFSQFEKLPEPLKQHARENLGRIQALAEKLSTSAPEGQNAAIREASVEELKLLTHLRTATVTAREIGAMEIQERGKSGSTAFEPGPKRNLLKFIERDVPMESIPSVPLQSPVDRAKFREAQTLADSLSAPHSQSEQCHALWSARTSVLKFMPQLEMVSPEIQRLASVELQERESLHQAPYVERYVENFNTLPNPLKQHAIARLPQLQALAEKMEAAPGIQNEAIRNAGLADLKILARLGPASVTVREMATLEISARESGQPTAFP